MKNYRPISLVNTDTKIFTRILNSRFMAVADTLVNEHQIGFIPGRYITENGLITQMVMEHAANFASSSDKSLALLLDQEKAYDRVNLDYLEKVLKTWGFPDSIVHSVIMMLRNNRITINVNGFLSNDVFKRRGLKQGDPVLPVLYSLSLEPFLLAVLQYFNYLGYTMKLKEELITLDIPNTSVNVKVLCYADDTLVFLQNLNDLNQLKIHLHTYCAASNTRINFNKVESILLSGRNHTHYGRSMLTDMNIPEIHLPTNYDPIVYLGFPLIQSSLQRKTYNTKLIAKIQQQMSLHSTRSLSRLGRATIANSLILSMYWYLFRVPPFTSTEVNKIRSVISKFINQSIFPRIKWSTLTLSKKEGDLNILDLHLQQSALMFRWIRPLLQEDQPPDTKVLNFLRIHIHNSFDSTHHTIPLLFQEGRRRPPIRLFNTCTLIVISIDRIFRDFSCMDFAYQTCLQLPIQAVFIIPDSSFKFPSICQQMKTHKTKYNNTFEELPAKSFGQSNRALYLSDVSLVNTVFHRSTPPDTEESRATNQFTPFMECLALPLPPNKNFEDINTKIFHRACFPKGPLPEMLRHIRPLHWFSFWSLNLTAIQRNIVFRLIHHKIPHKALLHRSLPAKVNTPHCSICLIHVDSLEHFLFDCQLKSAIWQTIIREFLWPTVGKQDIHSAFKTLNFDPVNYCTRRQISAKLVLILTLANIWKAHWYSIFNQTSFETTQVLNHIYSDIQTHIAEKILAWINSCLLLLILSAITIIVFVLYLFFSHKPILRLPLNTNIYC
ncbi:hypothetical protein G6F56_001689 [Rhizopus delemar]|nr:hypothetical protein G6F56_001689 [Rhizopus delemar]